MKLIRVPIDKKRNWSRREIRLKEGRGIIFEPGERHRINKGEGWMISISSLDYEDLDTNWES